MNKSVVGRRNFLMAAGAAAALGASGAGRRREPRARP